MCGTKIPTNSNFCSGCGRPLSEEEKQMLGVESSKQQIEANQILFEKTMQEKKISAQEQRVTASQGQDIIQEASEPVAETPEIPALEVSESSNKPQTVYDVIEEKNPEAGVIAREIERDIDAFKQESQEKIKEEIKPKNPYESAIASLHDIREGSKSLLQPKPEELVPDPVSEFGITKPVDVDLANIREAEFNVEEDVVKEPDNLAVDRGSEAEPIEEMPLETIEPTAQEDGLRFEELNFDELDVFLEVPTEQAADQSLVQAAVEQMPAAPMPEIVEEKPVEPNVPAEQPETPAEINITDIFAEMKPAPEIPAAEESKPEDPGFTNPNDLLGFLNSLGQAPDSAEPETFPKPPTQESQELNLGMANLVNDLFTGNLASPEPQMGATDELMEYTKPQPEPQINIPIPQEAPQVMEQAATIAPSPQEMPQITPESFQASPEVISQEEPQYPPSEIEGKKQKDKKKSKKRTILMVLLILLLIFVVFELIASVAILFFPESSIAIMFNEIMNVTLLSFL